MKINKRYVIIAVAAALIILVFFLRPANHSAQASDKEACEAQGGRWESGALTTQPYCNFPTTDAGKECADSSECEGACVADISREEIEAAGGIIHTHGNCTAWKTTIGCHAFVENGTVQGIVCIG